MAAPTVFTNDVNFQGAAVFGGSVTLGNGASLGDSAIAAGANVAYSKLEHLHHFVYQQSRRAVRHRIRSRNFNLDNGSGTTIDDAVMKPSQALTIQRAQIVYTTETTGTVAAANAKVGTTLGGEEVVAATAYENSKAVGTSTAMTVVSGAVAADGAVFVRHTGVASTAAGEAFVELEYTYDADSNNEVYDITVPLNIAAVNVGTLVSVEASVDTVPSSTRTHAIDLQKGNASTGYASVLAATLDINSSSVARTPQTASISTAASADGDSYQLVIASSGSGNNGRNLKVTIRYAEETA